MRDIHRVTIPGDKPEGLAYPFQKVKDFIKVTGSDQDAVISQMISAAADRMERATSISLLSRSYTMHQDGWGENPIRLSRTPVTAIDSVQYYDSDNNLQTLDSSNYITSLDGPRACVEIITSPTLKDRKHSVLVNFTAGYTTWEEIPDEVAIQLLRIIHLYYDGRQSDQDEKAIIQGLRNISQRISV
jgi:uncharacterized phiE125 gp8 family phage protein